jgi:hypothetical protein
MVIMAKLYPPPELILEFFLCSFSGIGVRRSNRIIELVQELFFWCLLKAGGFSRSGKQRTGPKDTEMKRLMIALSVVAVAIGVVGSCATASAAVLFDNLGAPLYGNSLIYPAYASSFSTGSSGFLLEDVKLVLSAYTDYGRLPSGGTNTVSLLSDNPPPPSSHGQQTYLAYPGAVLATIGTFSDSVLGSSPTVFDFPVTPGVNLTANTRYWIEVGTTDPSSVATWGFSTDLSGPLVPADEYSAVYDWYFDGTWYLFANSDYALGGGPYEMKVSGSEIPEPATIIVWSLLCLVAAGYGVWRRKRAA